MPEDDMLYPPPEDELEAPQSGANAEFAMSMEEITTELGVDPRTTERLLARALRKIERAGDMPTFNTVVRITRLKLANVPLVRCGSFECLTHRHVYFYGQ